MKKDVCACLDWMMGLSACCLKVVAGQEQTSCAITLIFFFYAWWLFFCFKYLNYCKWRWLWCFNVCVLEWEWSKWMTISFQLCCCIPLSCICFYFWWLENLLENWRIINPFYSSYCVCQFCTWCYVAVKFLYIYFKMQSKENTI